MPTQVNRTSLVPASGVWVRRAGLLSIVMLMNQPRNRGIGGWASRLCCWNRGSKKAGVKELKSYQAAWLKDNVPPQKGDVRSCPTLLTVLFDVRHHLFP